MSNTVARMIASCALAATAWQSPMRQANTLLRVVNLLYRRHTIRTAAGPVTFLSTHPQALDYPAGLLTREPSTINWLDTLDERCILWDIGANVGAYAIYAARRGARVWAFEPAPASFAALSENVRINGLDERIAALPVALSGRTGLGHLRMTATNPGSVLHTLTNVETADKAEDGADRSYRQATLGYTVDAFRRQFGLPSPTHIKLDVDGIEPDILEGARETLAAPDFISLLVEMNDFNTDGNGRIRRLAEQAGLRQMDSLSGDGNAIFARG